MAKASISSNGQITIPAVVRHTLKLKAGMRIQFLQGSYGRFSFVPMTTSILAMKAIVQKLGRVVSLEEMDDAIRLESSREVQAARWSASRQTFLCDSMRRTIRCSRS